MQQRSRNQSSNTGEMSFRLRLPRKRDGEIFAIADQLLGGSRIKAIGEDGKVRMTRIPGKLKKRMWIKPGDVLIIKPWVFQNEKADVVWRYTRTESNYLGRKKLLPVDTDIFSEFR